MMPPYSEASRYSFRPLGLFLFVFLSAYPAFGSDDRLKWDKKWGPLVPHSKFPKNCSLCHIPKRWDVIRSDFRFDHLKETGYALEGTHAQASCLRCHNDRGPVSAYMVRGCGGCHADPHKNTMGFNCTKCHDQTDWRQTGRIGEKIADHARTRFPLTGMHTMIQCQQCHTHADAGDFTGASFDCFSCHQKEFQRAPNHVAQNFSHNCQSCHNMTSWQGSKGFDHSTLGANPNCYSCHQAAYASAKATPASNHTTNAFPQSCQNCHNTTAWGPGTLMQHSFATSIACYTCHQANFQTAPNHVAQNLSTSCQNCHNTTTWQGANFNHANLGANPNCYSCHQAAYASAKATPASNHTTNTFPQSCQNCHNTIAWGPGTAMRHSFVTSIACNTCHSSEFTTATPPKTTFSANHPQNGFPQTCQSCHNTTLWGPGTIMNHGNVGGTGAQCQNCHMDEYNGTSGQWAHASLGFASGSCNTCHRSFTTWTSFTHTPSGCYPTHKGRSTSCAQCHTGSNYLVPTCSTANGCHDGDPPLPRNTSVCN